MADYASSENITNTTDEEASLGLKLKDSPVYITFLTILVVVCVISICTNLAITFTIFFNYSKNLKTVPNILIANWAVADLITLILSPIVNVGYTVLEYDSEGVIVFDFLAEFRVIFFNTSIFFALALVTDWCLASYFLKSSNQFRKYYKYVIASVWGYTLIFVCLSIGFNVTYGPFYIVPLVLTHFSYPILAFLVVLMHFVRICKSTNNPALTLMLATIFVVCWFEFWITMTYIIFGNLYFSFLEIPTYIPGIIIFIILYFKDQDFQTHLCIKCQRIKNISIKAYS
ncbi:hypothetical protein ILUMI_17400 [Ignelater luminosus]|uniref:G-protein coupled receptors family 1 profile domain-containing protein n=1 Tax=Ignelater luminosus TaxID=2038154 RepID=A0A8K0CJY3_IGNLU|nr:hypothetical protein ILUMI_17400 [Ignelater luminosus]